MFEDGLKWYMNPSILAKLTNCSTDPGLGDIQEFKASTIFIKYLGGGRSTIYHKGFNVFDLVEQKRAT